MFPILFPEILVHVNVAGAIKAMFLAEKAQSLKRNLTPEEKKELLASLTVPSAGSVTFYDVSCHGSSETLGVSSKEEDDALHIEMGQYPGWWVSDETENG